jgi:AcrR family transcriptional regulator
MNLTFTMKLFYFVEQNTNLVWMANKEEIRDELVQTARSVFARYGFRKTTMEDIAQAAGKGKSTLYYYFNNKEEIFRAVVEYEGNLLKNELLDVINDSDRDARQMLYDYVIIRWKGFGKLVNLYETMKKDFLNNYAFIQKYRRVYDDFEVKSMDAILRKGIADGQFTIAADDREAVAFTIVLAMKSLEIPVFAENKFDNLESRLNALLNVLFYGIVNPKN